MRVLVLHGYGLSGSGSCVYTSDLISALAEQGHRVDVVCHEPRLADRFPDAMRSATPNGLHRARLRGTGAPIQVDALTEIPVPVMYQRPEIPAGRSIGSWSNDSINGYVDAVYEHAATLCRRNHYDGILVNHLSVLCEVASRLSRSFGLGWSSIVHGTGLHYGLRSHPWLHQRVSDALSNCSSVVVLNDDVRNRVIDSLGSRCPHLVEVPPGVDTRLFCGEASSRPLRVSFCGRLILDKGVQLLLAAWPAVLRHHPTAELNIAGEGRDGDVLRAAFELLRQGDARSFVDSLVDHGRRTERAEMVQPLARARASICAARERLSTEQLARSVAFVGPLGRKAVARQVGASRLSVLPAMIPEAFPLAVLEAAAAGTLPIGTDVSGLSWLLGAIEGSDSRLGKLTVERTSPTIVCDLAERIVDTLDNPEVLRAASGAPRQFAASYDWRALADRLIEDTGAFGPTPARNRANAEQLERAAV